MTEMTKFNFEKLDPNAIYVMHVESRLSPGEVKAIRRTWEEAYPRPEKMLIVDQGLKLERNPLIEIVRDYAQHQSWRCGHPDRYPWEPDCPCGLLGALRSVGLPIEWAGNPEAIAEENRAHSRALSRALSSTLPASSPVTEPSSEALCPPVTEGSERPT